MEIKYKYICNFSIEEYNLKKMNYHNEFLKKINAKEKQRKEEQNQALKEKDSEIKLTNKYYIN